MAKKKKPATKKAGARNQGEQTLSMMLPLQYIVRAFLLGLFVLIPLNMSSNYTVVTTKIRSFYLLLILLGVSMLFVFFYLLGQGRKIRIDWKAAIKSFQPYEYAIFAYWVIALLSAILSPYPYYAWVGSTERSEGFYMQSLYIITFWMIARFYKPRAQDLLVLCVVASIVSAIGILQYYGLDFLNLSVGGEVGREIYLYSTMSNRNHGSVYFTLAFCVSYVLFTRKKERWHWAFFATTLLIFYSLLLSDTESGYVGVLVAGGLSLAFVVRDRKTAARLLLQIACCVLLIWVHGTIFHSLWPDQTMNFSSFYKFTPFVAVLFGGMAALFYFIKAPGPNISPKVWRIGWPVAVVALVLVAVLLVPVVAERTGVASIQELARILDGEVDDWFLSGRIFIWRRAVTLVPERPILGYGPDCFAAAFKPFYQESVDQMNVWFDKAHSEYIQTVVDEGILGLAALLAFYFLLFWGVRKKLGQAMPLALAVTMLCFLVQAIFNFSTPVTHSIVWAMWGVLGAFGRPSWPEDGAVSA